LQRTGVAGSLSNNNFTYNVAITGNGGGLRGGDAVWTMTNSLFLGNTAVNGGGMFWSRSGDVVSDCVFRLNSATGNGGAIADNGGNPTVSLTRCIVEDNTASGTGGGVHTNGLDAGIYRDSIFRRNSASIRGGCIDADGVFVNIELRRTIFEDCSAACVSFPL
jgi:hypothetical protein